MGDQDSPLEQYESFPIGARFEIVPPGRAHRDRSRVALVVARGAFGSGEHETTMSCLELMESMGDLCGVRVLDVGAGTGILGIAAVLCGASHAVLVDTDPRAVEASRLHAAINHVRDRVEVVHGQIADVSGDLFDVAFANIHGDVLISIAQRLVESVRPGGRIVLSGIAWEWGWPVREAYERRGCRLMKSRFLEEFSTILLARAEG